MGERERERERGGGQEFYFILFWVAGRFTNLCYEDKELGSVFLLFEKKIDELVYGLGNISSPMRQPKSFGAADSRRT